MDSANDSRVIEIRVNAMLQELAGQVSAIGSRAANLAAQNALLATENESLKKRIAELEA